MAREKVPAFQFYPKDFLSDTNVMQMTMTERGVYITLLSACWLDGSLPSDVDGLSRVVQMSPERFGKLWAGPLSRCFQALGGRLQHKRLDVERDKQAAFRGRQKDAAASRWHSHGIASVVPEACSPSPSSISSDLKEQISASFERFWVAYPKHTGRKAALTLWSTLKPDHGLSERITGAAAAYAKHVSGWSSDYIKAPIRWLEGAHWEDEHKPIAAIPTLVEWNCEHEPRCPHRAACEIVKMRKVTA